MGKKESFSILLIEDSQAARFMYKNILTKEGFVVQEAETGEAGVELMKKHSPDLVVLDLILPGMHGLEVLRWMRTHLPTQKTPVLVLTNVRDVEQVQNTLTSGANYYAHKESVTAEQIIDIVYQLLGIKRTSAKSQ